MEIFKVGDRQIHAGRSWVDSSGTRHPKTWHTWTAEEKKAKGISTVVLQPFPDQRLYTSSHSDDGSVSSTPRALDGEHGVKAALVAQVKQQQASLLAQSDWAIVRKADCNKAVPSNIQSWRDAIRSKSDAMESALNSAADTDAVAALFLNTDADGKKSGILYEWPEIDD